MASHKSRGADLYSKSEFEGAFAEFRAAVATTPSSALAWLEVDLFCLQCRSNAALCMLQLKRPSEARLECEAALALSCAYDASNKNLRNKVLRSQLQAAVDLDSSLEGGVLKVLDDHRRLGVFGSATPRPDLAKYLGVVSKLASEADRTPDSGSAVESAFNFLVRHWQTRSLVSQGEAAASQALIANASDPKKRAGVVLAQLQSFGDPLRRSLEGNSASSGSDGCVSPSPPPAAAVPLFELISMIISTFGRLHEQGPEVDPALSLSQSGLALEILNRGAHPCEVDSEGGGYLLWAVAVGIGQAAHLSPRAVDLCLAFLDLLDGCQCPMNQRHRERGATALHYAVGSCHPTVLAAFLDRGCDVHARDGEGWTPLMCACQNDVKPSEQGGPSYEERTAAVQALVDAGSRVNERNKDGSTALLLATLIPHAGIVAVLLRAGANPATENCLGLSAVGTVSKISKAAAPPSDDGGGEGEELAKCAEVIREADRTGASKLHEQAAKLAHLLDDVLVPANNRFNLADSLATRASFEQEQERRQRLGQKKQFGAGGKALTPEALKWKEERAWQERRVVGALLEHVGLDPKLVSQPLLPLPPSPPPSLSSAAAAVAAVATEAATATDGGDSSSGNWVFAVHHALMEMTPPAFLKVFCDESPSEEEYQLLASHNFHASKHALRKAGGGEGGVYDQASQRKFLLRPHRERGYVAWGQMENFRRLVVNPLQHCVGFAVPSPAMLNALAKHAPLVEAGAGTGYLAALLRRMGVDVLAYDLEPPTSLNNNGFFDTVFTEVLRGDCATLFDDDGGGGGAHGKKEEGGKGSRLSERTLVLVWPNNPDPWDNPELCSEAEKDTNLVGVWDLRCLESFLNAGGSTVIYVGEREENVRLTAAARSADCGVSASRAFQQKLVESFSLVEVLECPSWVLGGVEDLTVWKKKVSS